MYSHYMVFCSVFILQNISRFRIRHYCSWHRYSSSGTSYCNGYFIIFRLWFALKWICRQICQISFIFLPYSFTTKKFSYTETKFTIEAAYLQLIISSTMDSTFLWTALRTLSVKFLVSVHEAFFIVRLVISAKVCVFKSSVPSYQEILDKGLLSISRVSTTLFVSFTKVRVFPLITGLSVQKKNQIIKTPYV